MKSMIKDLPSLDRAAVKCGQKVVTDFSGIVTKHAITEIAHGTKSQSGWMVLVTPSVPKSSGGFIDAAWFKLCD